jgi:replicative DNA helicase
MAKKKQIDKEFLTLVQEEKEECFEQNYQSKFLKVFVEDRDNWCQQIMDIIFPEYFDGYHKILVNYQMKYFSKYRMQADYDDMVDMVNDNEKDSMVKEHLHALIEKIRTLELEYARKQSVKDRAYDYFKSKKVKNTLIELTIDLKNQTYESMKKKLEDALKAGEPKDIGHDYINDVEARMKKDYRNPISALPNFDEYIGGGLSEGELGIVIAPPGGGKSMMLVAMAANALEKGKKVVYYSFELSENVIGQRFDSCLNGIPLKDVWSFKEVIKAKELVDINAGLIIKRFPNKGATVTSLYAHIDSLKVNYNFVPDIVFVDYADIIKPSTIYNDKRHTLTEVYEELRGLAVDSKLPIWTASQTNREAMNADKFGLNTIGESLGKAATADLVVGVGRPDAKKNENLATVGILKNRNGADGIYLEFMFNTNNIDIKLLGKKEIENKDNAKVLIGAVKEDKYFDSFNMKKIMDNQKQ